MSQLNTFLLKIPVIRQVIEMEEKDRQAHDRARKAIDDVNGHIHETLTSLMKHSKTSHG